MKSKRKLGVEALEGRRLLASDLAIELDHVEVGSQLTVGEFGTDSIQRIAPLPPLFQNSADFIHEDGDRVVVVDSSYRSGHESRLWVFDRTDDGGLELAEMIDPGFDVEQLVVHGDHAVMLGTQWPTFDTHDPVLGGIDGISIDEPILPDWNPQTIIATVNLTSDGGVVRETYPGLIGHVEQQGDHLVVVLNDGLFWPLASGAADTLDAPESLNQMYAFGFGDDGLREIGSTEVGMGRVIVDGNTVLNVSSTQSRIHYILPPGPNDPVFAFSTNVTEFVIRDTSIEEVSSLHIGDGFMRDVELVNSDTLVVTRSGAFTGQPIATTLDIIDLSGDSLQVFESVQMPDFWGDVIASDSSHVLLSDTVVPGAVLVVDTNTSIDLAAENRIRSVEIDPDITLNGEAVEISNGLIVASGYRRDESDPIVALSTFLDGRFHSISSVLLTISLNDATSLATTELGTYQFGHPQRSLYMIDAQSGRFGTWSQQTSADGVVQGGFVYGRLNDGGTFVADGFLADLNPWSELDATNERLLVRSDGELTQFDWQSPEEPVLSIPLVDRTLPPIEAVNDEYVIDSPEDGETLHVLANDQIPASSRGHVEIVELIGAPEGTEVRGRAIHVPASAFDDVDTLRFEYVVTDGISTSRAVVELTVTRIPDDVIERLTHAVRVQAAEDFGVGIEDIEIGLVERLSWEMLAEADYGPTGIFSPGLLITLSAGDQVGMYFIDFETETPLNIFSTEREILVELGVRAVDANGERLEQVNAGESFWLEFVAKDLRDFGTGVYAAFFDLLVPTDIIALTDDIEYGRGFSPIAGGEITAGEIDDVGAAGDQVRAPGGDAAQVVFRVRAEAIAAGTVTLRPSSADGIGTETLVHGQDRPVDASSVRYRRTELEIVDARPDSHDTNGDGQITPVDALRVMNYLGENGSATLASLAERLGGGEGESRHSWDSLRRMDANGDETLTPLDSLVIINRLNKDAVRTADAESTIVPLSTKIQLFGDDDEEDELQTLL